ncbi:hypothetical protein [Wolbachia endosymbiont (group A) of Anthophora plumipes]|nr:hypothetical protein [Wolbachia endosymbiont of Nomada marshamella]
MFYFYAYQISLQSKFPGSQCLGTGMTGDTVLLVNKKIIKISQVAS